MTKRINRIAILIPDGEHALLARHVKNCFSEIPGVKLHIMSNQRDKAIRFSRYIASFSYYPKPEDEMEWITNINKEVERHRIDIVMPVYDESIRTLLKYENENITLYKKLVPLSPIKMFVIANNKALLAKHLEQYQIAAPKSFNVNLHDFTGIEEGNFPILVKPVLGIGGGTGIEIFKTKKEFINGFKPNLVDDSYVFEEFINGYDLGCNVLCSEGKILAFTIQKGTLFSAKKYAPQIGLEFLYEKELYEVVEKLMQTLNWTGVANVDMRYDSKDGKFKVLEINPRFWATLDASLASGVNFPYLYYLMSSNKKFNPPLFEHMHFLTLKGVLKHSKDNKRVLFKYKFIWKNTSLKYLLKDPLPFIVTILNKFKNNLLGLPDEKIENQQNRM